MKLINNVEKVIVKIENILAVIGGIAVLGMMLATTVDVVSRNVFRIQILGIYEFTQNILMPVVVIGAMGFTYRAGVLPRFDLLKNKLGDRVERIFSLSVSVIEVIVFSVLAYYAFPAAYLAFIDKRSVLAGGGALTTWPVFMLLPLSFTVMLLDSVIVFIKKVAVKKELAEK